MSNRDNARTSICLHTVAGGLTVLNWLISITSASFFTNWIIISFVNWRFHRALKAQNDQLFTEVYAWRSSCWPLAPAWLMLISVFLLVCCVFLGVEPPVSVSYLMPGFQSCARANFFLFKGGSGFSASNFFQYVLGLLLIGSFTIAYKIIYRTPWRDPRTADCTTGRRTLSADEIAVLDNYYRQPAWRRFLTYVQIW